MNPTEITMEDADRLNALMDADEATFEANEEKLVEKQGGTDASATEEDSLKNLDRTQATGTDKPDFQKTDKSGTPTATDKPAEQKADGKDKDQAKPEGDKAPEGSKFQKEKARQENAWTKINEQKAELQRKEQEILAREQEIAKKAQANAEPKYSAEDYDKAADKWEKEGKFDLAESARSEAKKLRANPPQTEKAPAARQNDVQFEQAQNQSWLKAQTECPEIAKKDSPLRQKTIEFIKANPEVLDAVNGPYLATKFVQYQMEAARVPDLQQKLESLTAKVKELEALTSITGGGNPASLPGERSFDDMSLAEQEAELKRMTA